MHTIYTYRWAAIPLLAVLFLPLSALSEELATKPADLAGSPLTGSVEASFDHTEASGTWMLHMEGSFGGDGVKVTDMKLLGTNAAGDDLSMQQLDMGMVPLRSPFAESFQIPKPDPDWTETLVDLTISNGTNSTDIKSSLFPILWRQPVLIDHAVSGSVITAPNYDPGAIPAGIGIPHTLINGLPDGDYYADVFFDGLRGCPSDNYWFNAFLPGDSWDYDGRPIGKVSKAYKSAAGGCMQMFHVDPHKNEPWLWGALSNTGTSSAIADASGIPAFAICATAAACDPIIPHAASPIPDGPATTTPAISDVLFLPGIKGSKLYEDNPLCLIPSDSCGIPLWLPLADAAVPELFLDSAGKSKRSVFVREGQLLDSAFDQDFYDSFIRTLDRAKGDGTFGKGWTWKAVAYDWRLSLPDIIKHGVQDGSRIYFGKTTDTPYIEKELRELASSSPTGKVTIVAHSNGGLVAKALMASLGDTLTAQLIDKVLFVGVPQSGAPRALGALLYGDEEGLPGIAGIPDFIMSKAHAREFGLDSPMAYHLLPSTAYMAAKQPEHPLVAFESGGLLAADRAAYGPTIDTEDELQSFAEAAEGDRTQPAAIDLTLAAVLNPSLLSYAASEHALVDTWQPPPGIDVYELGGYDVETISGIDMYQEEHPDGKQTLAYRPMFTPDGDGTVPLISSFLMNASSHVHQLWLDLRSMRAGKISYSHGNMMDAADVQDAITNILQGSLAYPSTVKPMDLAAAPLTSKGELAFYVHSPVSIQVTDATGNESSVSKDGAVEDIPESTADTFGEVKYVLVPADGGPYTLRLAGEGTGSMTLDLQEMDGGGVVTSSSTIADVPVEPSMQATLTITDRLQSASPLSVDEDDDGTPEFSIAPKFGATVFPTNSEPSSAKAPVRKRTANTHPEEASLSVSVSTTSFSSTSTMLSSDPPPAPVIEHLRSKETVSAERIVPKVEQHPVAFRPTSIALARQSFFVRMRNFVEMVAKTFRALLRRLGVQLGA